MKKLFDLHESDVLPGSKDADPSGFSFRKSARAVVFDEIGQVALLRVANKNYHKLPGGGIESGEDASTALERELLEEIGCKAEVYDEVGEIVEYRDEARLVNSSYCYLAKKVGQQVPPAYTEKERADGFEVIWAKNLDAAISLLQQDKPTDYTGQFIQQRDLAILETAKSMTGV